MTRILIVLFFAFSGITAVFSQNVANRYADVEVYYFHGARRCATCNAVEKVAQEALKQYFGDQIVLKSINRDEAKNSTLIKKYQVAGKKFDLTVIAFMNAERSPFRLKDKIKETIEKL
jgi:thiol-disulfide isomerase/thioredoxin